MLIYNCTIKCRGVQIENIFHNLEILCCVRPHNSANTYILESYFLITSSCVCDSLRQSSPCAEGRSEGEWHLQKVTQMQLMIQFRWIQAFLSEILVTWSYIKILLLLFHEWLDSIIIKTMNTEHKIAQSLVIRPYFSWCSVFFFFSRHITDDVYLFN